MSDMMTFHDTWEEYEKIYGFNDSEEIYTNNSRLIPSFRVKQWIDHESKQENKQQAIKASDSINREDAIANVALEIWHYPNELYTSLNCFDNCQELAERALNRLPSAQEENSEDTRAAYEQGRIQGHVEMRTALLRQLKEIVGDEVWKNI